MFKVGDELRLKIGDNEYLYSVVTNVDDGWVTCIMPNGRDTRFKEGYAKWRTTGRAFPEVMDVLNRIGKEGTELPATDGARKETEVTE